MPCSAARSARKGRSNAAPFHVAMTPGSSSASRSSSSKRISSSRPANTSSNAGLESATVTTGATAGSSPSTEVSVSMSNPYTTGRRIAQPPDSTGPAFSVRTPRDSVVDARRLSACDSGPMDDEVIVRVRTRDDERHELVATRDAIFIGGEAFPPTDIDSVQWVATRAILHGADMGAPFTPRVPSRGRQGDLALDSKSKNERLDEFAEAYGRVVSLLDAVVCPRLASEMATAMRGGETVTLGPTGARVELSAAGFRLKKPLSKVVPWERVFGTESEGGRIYFLVRKKDGEAPKQHSTVPLDGANIVV